MMSSASRPSHRNKIAVTLSDKNSVFPHMKTKLPLVVVAVVALGASGCTFPSSRPVVPAGQAGVVQTVETGVVASVREVNIEGRRTALGTFGGGMIGSAAATGGHGTSGALVHATGAVAGAIAGEAVEEAATRKTAQEILIHMDDGRTVVVTQAVDSGLFRDGDRVRIMNGGSGARVAMDLGGR
jgi:outer membrane lipoprotein SlyB